MSRRNISCLKPKLTSAEGASGSHANAIQEAYEDFLALAKTITADTELI